MTNRRLLAASTAIAVVTGASFAQADPKTHDGFYIRLATGPGMLRTSRELEVNAFGREYPTEHSSILGSAGHLELTLGGTPAPGFVVGGSVLSWFAWLAGTEFRRDDGTIRDLDDVGLVVIGPSIDGFTSKARGFHVGFVLGAAAMWAQLPEEEVFENIGGTGGAVSFALGYDWWLADEWSLGFVTRLTGALIGGQHTDMGATAEETSGVGTFGVAITTLFH